MATKLLLISQEKVHAAVNGATKVLYFFANEMARRGYEVVVTYPAKEFPQVDPNLDKSISFYNMDYMNISGFKSKRRRVSLIDRYIRWRCPEALKQTRYDEISDKIEYIVEKEKPDIIIPFFAHVACQILFEKKYEIPILQMYHTHPKVYHIPADWFNKKSKQMAIFFNYCVKKISALQVFFPSYVEYMRPFYKGKIRVIHNPVKIPQTQVDLTKTKKKLIYLSRIDKNKGQAMLIDAFARMVGNYPDWELLLYGDFEPKGYKKVIVDLIAKHKIEKNVKIMGVTDKPSEAFLDADLGVYTSAFEGFPLGLSEALAAGLPCIGLKTATGINELIVDRENGLLTEPHIIDIARKLTELMNNQPLRIKYGQNARESMKKYSEEMFFAKWDALIEDALSEVRNSKKLINIT